MLTIMIEYLDYFVFGVVDNSVLILGALFGLSVERLLPVWLQQGRSAVLGAGIGNAVSDWLGGASTLNWPLAWGTFFGCIAVLVFVPLYFWLRRHS